MLRPWLTGRQEGCSYRESSYGCQHISRRTTTLLNIRISTNKNKSGLFFPLVTLRECHNIFWNKGMLQINNGLGWQTWLYFPQFGHRWNHYSFLHFIVIVCKWEDLSKKHQFQTGGTGTQACSLWQRSEYNTMSSGHLVFESCFKMFKVTVRLLPPESTPNPKSSGRTLPWHFSDWTEQDCIKVLSVNNCLTTCIAFQWTNYILSGMKLK